MYSVARQAVQAEDTLQVCQASANTFYCTSVLYTCTFTRPLGCELSTRAAVLSDKSWCSSSSSSSSHGWELELGCQRWLEGAALGLKQQLSDWQLLITATRQNGTVKYFPSPLNLFSFSHPVLLTPPLPLRRQNDDPGDAELHFDVSLVLFFI